MEIVAASEALNIFRFVGHTRYWEDNVTRGLLSLITRSASGGLVLKELLELCAGRVAREAASEAHADALSHAIRTLDSVEVRGQTSFGAENDEGTAPAFGVLVALTPASAEGLPQATRPDGESGRFDAVLACQSHELAFDVVVEAKLYGALAASNGRATVSTSAPIDVSRWLCNGRMFLTFWSRCPQLAGLTRWSPTTPLT